MLILPECVSVHEIFGGVRSSPPVQVELEYVQNSCLKRREDFLTGRECAHKALARFGLQSKPILRGSKGQPLWPLNYVGSITHCVGYCAAAVAATSGVGSIGIDAEPHAGLDSDILPLIASAPEIEHLNALPSTASWDRLLFSAKESIYKAWHTLMASWLDFKDVRITIEVASESFEVLFVKQPIWYRNRSMERIAGKFHISDDLIVTSVVVMDQ